MSFFSVMLLMGGTIYRLRSLQIAYTHNWFIPSSRLSEWRRKLTEVSEEWRVKSEERKGEGSEKKDTGQKTTGMGLYLLNVMNHRAKEFYEEQGCEVGEWAYERSHPSGVPVMFCKHCLKYSLGLCPKEKMRVGSIELKGMDSLYLQLANGTRFRLAFDCKNCIMQVIKDAE